MAEYPSLEYANVFLFGFRMPLFFIASGMFLSASIQKKGFNHYNVSRLQTILYPMFIWGFIQLSLQIIFNNYTNVGYQASDYLWLLIDPRRTGQFWYLNTLFFVGMLYSIFKIKLNLKTRQQLALGLFMYGTVAMLRSEGLYFGFIMDILQYYLFFAIGDLVSNRLKDHRFQGYYASKYVLAMLIPIFIFIQYHFTDINLSHKSHYFVEHHMPVFYLVVALTGCAFSMNISFLLARLNKMRFLKIVGFHSIHIYCMQIITMAMARMVLVKFLHVASVPLLVILVLVTGILLPIIAYNFLMRLNAWWLFSLKKPAEQTVLQPAYINPTQTLKEWFKWNRLR
jgi:fucose 4-O-acetylase-like acetyltransferase